MKVARTVLKWGGVSDDPACKHRLFLPGQFFNRSEAIGLIILARFRNKKKHLYNLIADR